MGFQSVPNLATLNGSVAVIMRYFTQNGSFWSWLHQIYGS